MATSILAPLAKLFANVFRRPDVDYCWGRVTQDGKELLAGSLDMGKANGKLEDELYEKDHYICDLEEEAQERRSNSTN